MSVYTVFLHLDGVWWPFEVTAETPQQASIAARVHLYALKEQT